MPPCFPTTGRRARLSVLLLCIVASGFLPKAFINSGIVPASASLAKPRRVSAPRGRTERSGRVHCKAVFSVLAEEVNSRPSFFFGEVLVIVVLSTGFEKAENWLRRTLKLSGDRIGREILDALFREITILGFIGLLLFVLTHLLPEDTPIISLGPGEYNILPETFEYVHMATFLLLVVLLFQGFAVLKISRETANTWAEYEGTRAFGTNPTSLESLMIEEGYLERRPLPHSDNFELLPVKNFGYGDTLLERFFLRGKKVHKLVMWRAVRHGFLFDGPQSEMLVNEEGVIPGLFSFESFLEQQLGQIVLALVEVDVSTWFVSMVVCATVTGICLALDSVNAQLMQCFCCWGLFVVGLIYSVILEEDTWELTPQVPEDARNVLRLFSGTSIQMLRRSSWLGRTPEQAVAKILSLSGRRYRPKMPGIDGTEWPSIRPTPKEEHGSSSSMFFLIPEYTVAFKLLCFLQATVVASLIVELLNGSIHGLDRSVPFVLACIEWPLMLFWLVPELVRRLTLRAALTRTRTNTWFRDKQRGLVRQVMVAGIEGLLRDCTRLIHLQGMESRAVMIGETWAQPTAVAQAMTAQSRAYLENHLRNVAMENVSRGTELFDNLPPNLKNEVSSIFTSWDATNSGVVAPMELANNMDLMGYSATSDRVAKNLIRLVDSDGSGLLTWRKCRAMFMLATAGRPMGERRRDLNNFFTRVQKANPRSATVFELAEALPLHSITPEDLSSLMYRHFGRVKPSVTRAEFLEWIEAVELASRY